LTLPECYAYNRSNTIVYNEYNPMDYEQTVRTVLVTIDGLRANSAYSTSHNPMD